MTEKSEEDLSLDVLGVMDLLPHRYPFLLVDRLVECNCEGQYAIGHKMVTYNEPYFPGHFPDMPVMPGVLQAEAIAQVGALFVLRAYPEVRTKAIYLMSMDNCRYRKPVMPGSVLEIKATLAHARHARLIYKFEGVCSVNGEVVSQADITAMGVHVES